MVLSATNRGAKRRPQDFYSTPIECVTAILNELDVPDGIKILDPCAGSGHVIQAIREGTLIENYDNVHIDAIEIRPEEENILKPLVDSVKIADFLDEDIHGEYDLVISNPPYSLAQEFIDKGLECLNENGKLVYLLRTNFLESKKRFQWWQDKLPSGIYVLHARPSFTGSGKTDATSYAWFVWDKSSDKQVIKVI